MAQLKSSCWLMKDSTIVKSPLNLALAAKPPDCGEGGGWNQKRNKFPLTNVSKTLKEKARQ